MRHLNEAITAFVTLLPPSLQHTNQRQFHLECQTKVIGKITMRLIIQWLAEAWSDVSLSTIKNCWLHAESLPPSIADSFKVERALSGVGDELMESLNALAAELQSAPVVPLQCRGLSGVHCDYLFIIIVVVNYYFIIYTKFTILLLFCPQRGQCHRLCKR